MNHKKVFDVGKGDNIRIMSISKIYHLFISVLLRPHSRSGIWNEDGYYLAENESYVAREMLKLTAQIAHAKSLIPMATVDFVFPEEADKLLP